MTKILTTRPSGLQEIIEVGPGGGVGAGSVVVWNEKVDGPIPDVQPGGLVKSGDKLVVDAAALMAHQSALAARSDAENALATREAERRAATESLKGFDSARATLPQVAEAIDSVLIFLGIK